MASKFFKRLENSIFRGWRGLGIFYDDPVGLLYVLAVVMAAYYTSSVVTSCNHL